MAVGVEAAAAGKSSLSTGQILALAAGGLGAAGSLLRGGAQRQQAEFQAAVSERQARRDRAAAAEEARRFQRRNRRLLAASRARRGASGVTTNTGSSLLVEEDLAAEVELGRLDILNAGEVSAINREDEARLQRRQGRAAAVQGFFGAGTSILRGVRPLFEEEGL